MWGAMIWFGFAALIVSFGVLARYLAKWLRELGQPNWLRIPVAATAGPPLFVAAAFVWLGSPFQSEQGSSLEPDLAGGIIWLGVIATTVLGLVAGLVGVWLSFQLDHSDE
jgi:hypothetical protein